MRKIGNKNQTEKRQENPMQEPIRSEKELPTCTQTHRHAHIFKKKVQRKPNCCGKGTGRREKRKKRSRLKSQDLDRVKLEGLASKNQGLGGELS